MNSFAVSQALLCLLSVLPSRGVPLGLFEGHVAEDQLPYGVLFSTGGLADALGPLLEEDLVRQQPDGSLDVHNMVQHSSRALLSAGPEQTVLDTLGTLFADRFIAGSKQAHRTGLKTLVGCVLALQPACYLSLRLVQVCRSLAESPSARLDSAFAQGCSGSSCSRIRCRRTANATAHGA